MRPLPWSFSSLDDFINCPRAFYEKKIAKSVKPDTHEALIWGERVHKFFELRQANGEVLPEELSAHEPFMQQLQNAPGQTYTERKIALNMQRRPCSFFAKDVWFRGVIDYAKVNGKSAHLVDYKTGKPHSKFKQLTLFALYTFIELPEVEEVHVEFYWTKTRTTTGQTYKRADIPQLWEAFVPDLRQYVAAFHTDVWQPRQSGLCNGWCPVVTCEFWKPRRNNG